MNHTVAVGPIPDWVDAGRLLGPGEWEVTHGTAQTSLPTASAADVQARLRGVGLGGHAIGVRVTPPLRRPAVRAARTRDARARRDTTPGFTRSGARTDEEGRYSLTPESLALHMGRAAAPRTVLDLGCGAGGNAIGFARAGCEVIAVERDASRAALARHNAALYGVSDRVTVHTGDAVSWLTDARADLLFVDPPWGTDWDRTATSAADFPLLVAALATPLAVWAKLPPSFNPSGVPGAHATAVFGEQAGDRHRVKFIWLRRPA